MIFVSSIDKTYTISPPPNGVERIPYISWGGTDSIHYIYTTRVYLCESIGLDEQKVYALNSEDLEIEDDANNEKLKNYVVKETEMPTRKQSDKQILKKLFKYNDDLREAEEEAVRLKNAYNGARALAEDAYMADNNLSKPLDGLDTKNLEKFLDKHGQGTTKPLA